MRDVDLNSACALYLAEVENESAFYRLADALVPPNMLALFEGGDTSLEAARKAFDHALQNPGATGPRVETIFCACACITSSFDSNEDDLPFLSGSRIEVTLPSAV